MCRRSFWFCHLPHHVIVWKTVCSNNSFRPYDFLFLCAYDQPFKVVFSCWRYFWVLILATEPINSTIELWRCTYFRDTFQNGSISYNLKGIAICTYMFCWWHAIGINCGVYLSDMAFLCRTVQKVLPWGLRIHKVQTLLLRRVYPNKHFMTGIIPAQGMWPTLAVIMNKDDCINPPPKTPSFHFRLFIFIFAIVWVLTARACSKLG